MAILLAIIGAAIVVQAMNSSWSEELTIWQIVASTRPLPELAIFVSFLWLWTHILFSFRKVGEVERNK